MLRLPAAVRAKSVCTRSFGDTFSRARFEGRKGSNRQYVVPLNQADPNICSFPRQSTTTTTTSTTTVTSTTTTTTSTVEASGMGVSRQFHAGRCEASAEEFKPRAFRQLVSCSSDHTASCRQAAFIQVKATNNCTILHKENLQTYQYSHSTMCTYILILCICICICIRICINICVCTCTCTCSCLCMFIVHVCIYIYTVYTYVYRNMYLDVLVGLFV